MTISWGSHGKESVCYAGDPGSIPGQKDPLEKEMATHSNIFAWKTPWTEEPGGLHPRGHKELDMTKHAGRMKGKKLPDQLADLKK